MEESEFETKQREHGWTGPDHEMILTSVTVPGLVLTSMRLSDFLTKPCVKT